MGDVEFQISRLRSRIRSIVAHLCDGYHEVPRHRFVPDEQRRHAYETGYCRSVMARTISQPLIVAVMTELSLQSGRAPGSSELGTGSGYQAAVLAALGAEVYSVRSSPRTGRTRTCHPRCTELQSRDQDRWPAITAGRRPHRSTTIIVTAAVDPHTAAADTAAQAGWPHARTDRQPLPDPEAGAGLDDAWRGPHPGDAAGHFRAPDRPALIAAVDIRTALLPVPSPAAPALAVRPVPPALFTRSCCCGSSRDRTLASPGGNGDQPGTGFGASGTFIAVFRNALERRFAAVFVANAMLFGLSSWPVRPSGSACRSTPGTFLGPAQSALPGGGNNAFRAGLPPPAASAALSTYPGSDRACMATYQRRRAGRISATGRWVWLRPRTSCT